MPNINFLYSTAPDLETARKIAGALIEAKLAACVNMLPAMRSVYQWEGAVEEAEEVSLFVKTTREAAAAASELIRKTHPYETPCVLSFEAAGPGLNPDFAKWIEVEVTGA